MREAINFVTTWCVTRLFLQVFANVVAHGRTSFAAPTRNPASHVAKAMCRNITNYGRDFFFDIRFRVLKQALKLLREEVA